MVTKRTACLTGHESKILGRLFAYAELVLLPGLPSGFCLPKHLGGEKQSHHGKTLRRLVSRGLCVQHTIEQEAKRDVCAYKLTAEGRVVWNMYLEHTGEQLNVAPKLRAFMASQS